MNHKEHEGHKERRCRPLNLIALVLAWQFVALINQASADFLIYRIPGTDQSYVLQGRVQVFPDRTVSYYHPALKQALNFPLAGVDVLDLPTTSEQFKKKLTNARDAEASYAAAVWVLKHGLVPEFYKGVDQTLEKNPKHESARAVKALKLRFERPLPDSAAQETELRKLVSLSTAKTNPVAGMKLATSRHFVLLHDTNDELPPKDAVLGTRRKRRAALRLELLEQVYETFLLWFQAHGVPLEVPHERLKVILFEQFADFERFSRRHSPALASASGYWDPAQNVSVFYDSSSDETLKLLKQHLTQIQLKSDRAARQRSPQASELSRFVNTLQLLLQIAQENTDIEVVSHEATHQLAGNTGLFPRHVRIPAWAHEGLATYFESPGERGWSGVGAINKQRLERFRTLSTRQHNFSIGLIVGDQIFQHAATSGDTLRRYGQAWALTHFLMEKHLPETVEYYRRLGQLPPDTVVSPDILTALFNQTFGPERPQLDEEWRVHMQSLEPDFEKAQREAEAKKKK